MLNSEENDSKLFEFAKDLINEEIKINPEILTEGVSKLSRVSMGKISAQGKILGIQKWNPTDRSAFVTKVIKEIVEEKDGDLNSKNSSPKMSDRKIPKGRGLISDLTTESEDDISEEREINNEDSEDSLPKKSGKKSKTKKMDSEDEDSDTADKNPKLKKAKVSSLLKKSSNKITEKSSDKPKRSSEKISEGENIIKDNFIIDNRSLSEFKMNTDPIEIKDFPIPNPNSATTTYLKTILGDKFSDYIKVYDEYISHLNTFRKSKSAHNAEKFYTLVGKKVSYKIEEPKTTKSKSAKKYDLKTVVMEEEDAEPIIQYHKYVSEMKKSVKPPTFMEYLKSDIIKTINILDLKSIDLKKVIPDYREETLRKELNIIYTGDSEKEIQENIEKIIDEKSSVDPPFTKYFDMFSSISGFNGKNLMTTSKSIYSHRFGIITNPKLTSHLKEKLWFQALSNINTYEGESDIITVWKNLLQSKYVFYVMMYGLVESQLFKKSFEKFIADPLNMKLFASLLYPISFLFTPFMLGSDDFKYERIDKNSSAVTYRKKILATYSKLLSSSKRNQKSPIYDYDECNWIYYILKDSKDNMNPAIRLLQYYISTLKAVERKTKDPKNPKKSTRKLKIIE